ncbi:MAG: MFS transporter [Candidatus Berkiella sp.]
MQLIEQPTSKKFLNYQLAGWLFWSVGALFYAYEFFHRVVPGVLTTHLREILTINDKQLGLIGAMYLYAYAGFQLPAGILIDKYGPKKLLVFASLLVTIGSFAFTFSINHHWAYFSRFLIGAGSAFAFVGCLKIGSQWLAMSSFPLVVGLTNFCGTLGALSGGAPFSWLIEKVGYKTALFDLSFVGLAITALLFLILKDKPEEESLEANKKELHTMHSILTGLGYVLRSKQTWYISLFGTLLVMPIAALPEMWGPEYLVVAYSIPKTQAAALTHTIFVGTAIGGPLVGWLATRVSNLKYIMFPATLGALLLLSIFLYVPHTTLKYLYPLLFLYGILTANMLLSFSIIKQSYPDSVQGSAIGFVNMIIMLCGGFAQYGIGWLLDRFRSQHDGIYLLSDYHLALSILPFCLIFAVGLTILINGNHKNFNA